VFLLILLTLILLTLLTFEGCNQNCLDREFANDIIYRLVPPMRMLESNLLAIINIVNKINVNNVNNTYRYFCIKLSFSDFG